MVLADGALYWAKAHGRDITFLYTPEIAPPGAVPIAPIAPPGGGAIGPPTLTAG
jgi:hypothetical protein